jgi:hypothetical protein
VDKRMLVADALEDGNDFVGGNFWSRHVGGCFATPEPPATGGAIEANRS